MTELFSILNDYFTSPITDHSGYNPVNTLVYALIAVVVSFFIIYPYMNKKKIKFDYKFALSVLPYVILGSTIRIFEEVYSTVYIISRSISPFELGFYFISPGIYVMIGILTVVSLIVSIRISKKKKWDKLNVFRNIGIILVAPVLLWHFLHLTHPEAMVSIIVTVSGFSVGVVMVYKKFKNKLFKNKLNILALVGQTLDGAATAIILQFYPVYREQHFVSNAIIQTFGPFVFLITKILVVIVVLYFMDYISARKEITGNFAGFVKILIIILGFATGTRDMFSVAMTTAI